MTASDAAAFSTAITRAASASDTWWRRSAPDAVSFQGAHGSTSFHFCATFVCSGVRSRATRRTSSSAALCVAEPYAGGGAGRNWAAESSNHPREVARGSPIGGTPGALYHIPGPEGIVPFDAATKLNGGAQAITRLATSSPIRLPAIARPAPRDPVCACSMSRVSSRAIDARTVESLNSCVNTAAEALATATSEETARLSLAEFAAPYCAMLRRVYTRKSIGGGGCAIWRHAAGASGAGGPGPAARRPAGG